MKKTFETKTLSVTIQRDPAAVYRFVSNPKNLPVWAGAFCKSARKSGTDWIIETIAGPMQVRFAAKNSFGILDHHVYPAPKIEVCVPMRVVPNGTGSEVVFTLFRQPKMTRSLFQKDIGMVTRDLKGLKKHLELRGGR